MKCHIWDVSARFWENHINFGGDWRLFGFMGAQIENHGNHSIFQDREIGRCLTWHEDTALLILHSPLFKMKLFNLSTIWKKKLLAEWKDLKIIVRQEINNHCGFIMYMNEVCFVYVIRQSLELYSTFSVVRHLMLVKWRSIFQSRDLFLLECNITDLPKCSNTVGNEFPKSA